MLGLLRFSFCLLICLGASLVKADVLPIQSFKTPTGLEVWLVEDHTSPVVSLAITFEKSKIECPFTPSALLLQNSLSDGAGITTPLKMNRFIKETPSLRQVTIGISKAILEMKTTTKGLSDSLQMWSRLIGTPQFQKADLAHSKSQASTFAAHLNQDLNFLAFLNLLKEIFPQVSSFGVDLEKIPHKIQTITPEDLDKEQVHQFLTEKPKIVVVGNVGKSELTVLLDATFGTLPFEPLSSLPQPSLPQWTGKDVFIEKDVPQAVIAFGQPGIHPLSQDYPLYLLLQNVLNVRLMDELREKRGLIYSLQFQESHYKNVDLLRGNFSCEPLTANKVIKFIRSEWERLKDFGITQKELTQAKLFFEKSHILTLTSTGAVADIYSEFQAFNLGPDTARLLLEKTEKVTLEEINVFTEQVLKPELLTFVVVGPNIKEKQ